LLLFQYILEKFNFSPISPHCFSWSLLWYCLSLWSQRGSTSIQVLSYKFCPLQQNSNHMLRAAGVWSDSWLKTNLWCWTKKSGVVGKQLTNQTGFNVDTAINTKVVDFYYLDWSLSRLLCHVGSASNPNTTVCLILF